MSHFQPSPQPRTARVTRVTAVAARHVPDSDFGPRSSGRHPQDHNLLVSELQSLIVESKRRNPEVKDAGEAALEILRPGPQPREVLVGECACTQSAAVGLWVPGL